jgi:hypothetical protein
MPQYTDLRPFFSAKPTDRLRHLTVGLNRTQAALHDLASRILHLPPLSDANQVTNTHAVCLLMIQASESIDQHIDQPSSPITNEWLHELSFDLIAKANSITACADLIQMIVHQQNTTVSLADEQVIMHLVSTAHDLGDIIHALLNPIERTP